MKKGKIEKICLFLTLSLLTVTILCRRSTVLAADSRETADVSETISIGQGKGSEDSSVTEAEKGMEISGGEAGNNDMEPATGETGNVTEGSGNGGADNDIPFGDGAGMSTASGNIAGNVTQNPGGEEAGSGIIPAAETGKRMVISVRKILSRWFCRHL